MYGHLAHKIPSRGLCGVQGKSASWQTSDRCAATPQAFETRSQRGMKRLQADPMFPVSGHRVNKDDSANNGNANVAGANANGANAKTANV